MNFDAVSDKALVVWEILDLGIGGEKGQAFDRRARRGGGYDGRTEDAGWSTGRRIEAVQYPQNPHAACTRAPPTGRM